MLTDLRASLVQPQTSLRLRLKLHRALSLTPATPLERLDALLRLSSPTLRSSRSPSYRPPSPPPSPLPTLTSFRGTATSQLSTAETSLFSDDGDVDPDYGSRSGFGWAGEKSIPGLEGWDGGVGLVSSGGGNSFAEDLVVIDEGPEDDYTTEGEAGSVAEPAPRYTSTWSRIQPREVSDRMPSFSTRRDDLLVNTTPPPPSARSTPPPAPPVVNTSRTRGGLQNLLGKVEDRTLSHLEPSYSSSNQTTRARIPSGGGNLDAFRNLRAAIARAQSSPPTTPHAPLPLAQHQEDWDSHAPEASTSRSKSAAVESWLSNSRSPQPSPPRLAAERRSFLPPPTDLRSARGFPLPEGGRRASRSPEPEDPLPTDEDSPPTPPLRLPPGFGRREKEKTYEEEETPAPSYVRKSSAPPTLQPGHSLQAFLGTHPQPSIPQPPHHSPSPPPSPINQTTMSSPRRRTASAIKGKQRADLSTVAGDESLYGTPKAEYDESLVFRPSKQLRRSPSSSFAQPTTQRGAPPPPTPARSNSNHRPSSQARPPPPRASSQSPPSRSTPRQGSRMHKNPPQASTRKSPTPFTTPSPSNTTSAFEHFSTPAVSFTPSRSRITPRRSSTPPPLTASSPLKIIEDEEPATEESDVPMSEDEASQPESLEGSSLASPSPPHETTLLPDVTPSEPVEAVESSPAEADDQLYSEPDAMGQAPEPSEEEEERQEEEFDIVPLSPAREVHTTTRQSPSSARSARSPSQTPTAHAPSSPLATVQTPAAARVRDVMRGAATPRAPGGWGWTPGGREKGKGQAVDEQVEEEVEEIVVLRRKKVDSHPVAQVQASIPCVLCSSRSCPV